ESIHKEQLKGKDARRAALDGTNAVALPVLASTLTTMAVLLPVLLLSGLAKKLFAPLALTVAVAMTASYFVSIGVTPVACRFFLTHGDQPRWARWLEGLIGRIADTYTRALRAVLPSGAFVILGCTLLVGASVFAAMRLPTTFFPEVDEAIGKIIEVVGRVRRAG
ncbi:MAG TPA: efflux RND transporter permease subunit, partial [Polyangiaceae bacterium]|nr:efflux RND transporter permease subunit [Polyangiaceae bacterium]